MTDTRNENIVLKIATIIQRGHIEGEDSFTTALRVALFFNEVELAALKKELEGTASETFDYKKHTHPEAWTR